MNLLVRIRAWTYDCPVRECWPIQAVSFGKMGSVGYTWPTSSTGTASPCSVLSVTSTLNLEWVGGVERGSRGDECRCGGEMNVGGCGEIEMDVGGCGWRWMWVGVGEMDVGGCGGDGCGWVWGDGCGWVWGDGCGWVWGRWMWVGVGR